MTGAACGGNGWGGGRGAFGSPVCAPARGYHPLTRVVTLALGQASGKGQCGEKSAAHSYAVETYLQCKQSGLIPRTQEACVAQVITLSRVKGPVFESQVLAAISDIGL